MIVMMMMTTGVITVVIVVRITTGYYASKITKKRVYVHTRKYRSMLATETE